MIAVTPTATMITRYTRAGSLRPTWAPTSAPSTDPTAIATAAHQFTSEISTKTTPATPFTIPASRFLAALIRDNVSDRPMPRMAISSTPWAAPK